MAEAEDVILHAAERVTTAARSVWRRYRPPDEPQGTAFVDVVRRLSVLVQACFGRQWPLIPIDPDAAPSWLAMRLRGLPPWVRESRAHPYSDGVSIFLPRHLSAFGDAARDADLLRLMALVLAARLKRGSVARCPIHPIVRDLFWAADGAAIEGSLVEEFPGLGAPIAATRRLALACRPPLEAMKGHERAVEAVVRQLLQAPPGALDRVFPDAPPGTALPEELADWADRMARQPAFQGKGVYRGLAPVLHWGRPRPDLLGARTNGGRQTQSPGTQRPPGRSQRLPHRVEAKEISEDGTDARQGPFLIPHGDPEQSVEDPAGLRRPLDQGQEPELEALAAELARLGQVPRVESDAPVDEILEMEGVRRQQPKGCGTLVSETTVGLVYPEWDYRLNAYRQGHCVLRESAAPLGDAQWSAQMLGQHRGLIYTIRRRFEALRPVRRCETRQLEGDELDLDAYVDDFAARRGGRTPSDRLYLADRPRWRDVSVAFLIDASGSTDAWVSGGRRVLDIEKEASLVFCEALEALGDRYAVYTFAGHGARDIRVRRVKGFSDGYGEAVRRRLAGLQGEAYTRLGAPIRHLTAQLTRQRARLRLLFLLSDGKPNDEDAYEGTYGIEDTRQAVAEARMQGVQLFCLAIDRQQTTDLPRMFGPRGYAILWDVSQLPQRLPEIYRRLTVARP